MSKTELYFDADMLAYQACVVNENPIEWTDGTYTIHCYLDDVIKSFNTRVDKLVQLVTNHYKIKGYKVYMALTSSDYNFRRTVLTTYKSNRAFKKRPMCLQPMRDYIHDNYLTLEMPHLEADDVIGIHAGDNKNAVMISGDKDFRSIPQRFYDFSRDEFFETTEEDAQRWHLMQTLMGDSVDGYRGCPTIGKGRAGAILDESPTWEAVVKAYESQGLTADDALVQARCAYILRHKREYNEKTGEIYLWKPAHD